MPLQCIDGNILKSHKTCLTNHMWPISHHIMQLVIYTLRVDTQTDIQTETHTHTDE